MMWNRYTERTYFTMEESNINENTLKPLCKEPDSEITTEFLRLFMIHFKYNWMTYTDVEFIGGMKPDAASPNQVKVQAWESKFTYAYAATFDKYSKLVELYNTQKTRLLDKVGNTSTIKFNDTPQEDNVPTDGYTSTVTTSKNEVDPGEMINRLKNIEDNYKNTYRDWLKEFDFLFGEELI